MFDALNRASEAAAAADRAIALNPRSGAAFMVRGIIEARTGETEQAVADYDEAIRLAPALATAYKARAKAETRLGRSAQATADSRMAADIEGSGAPSSAPVRPADSHIESLLAAPALSEAEIKKLYSDRAWQARQGPWLATMEFRADGAFHEHLKDSSAGSTLEVSWDGVWGATRDALCIYTNVGLCLTVHAANGELVLVRAEKGGTRAAQQGTAVGTVEYVGAAETLAPLTSEASSRTAAEFPIEERLLRAAPTVKKGPKTLFYYMHGFDGHAREHSPLPEYFVSELQLSRGWDVIDGNYPRAGVAQIRRLGAANLGAAVFLARRLKELKAQGYERIYVGGQSWGGWNALILATMPNLPLDGVVLVVRVPRLALDGRRSRGHRTMPTTSFCSIRSSSACVIRPSVCSSLGDEYEPADRGAGAAATLTSHGVANLIIDHPPGFSGHGSAWFPPFDYLYGACIADFLESPHTEQCERRHIPLEVGDFRGIVVQQQIGRRHLEAATLAELKDRQFAVYPQGEVRDIVSAEQTEVKGFGIGDGRRAPRSAVIPTVCVHASSSTSRRPRTRSASAWSSGPTMRSWVWIRRAARCCSGGCASLSKVCKPMRRGGDGMKAKFARRPALPLLSVCGARALWRGARSDRRIWRKQHLRVECRGIRGDSRTAAIDAAGKGLSRDCSERGDLRQYHSRNARAHGLGHSGRHDHRHS